MTINSIEHKVNKVIAILRDNLILYIWTVMACIPHIQITTRCRLYNLLINKNSIIIDGTKAWQLGGSSSISLR